MSVEARVFDKKKQKGFGNKVFSFAMGTLASRVLGLFRDLVMAAVFDRVVTDAWTAAFRIPTFFRRLFGEGCLAAAFTPIWIDVNQRDPLAGKELWRQFLSFVSISMLGVSLVLMVFSRPLLDSMLAAEFVQDTQRYELAIQMLRIMALFICFASISGLVSALLQIHDSFGWTGIAPTLFNIGMLIFTLLPLSFLGFPGAGLAWGVFVGGLAQLLMLAYLAHKQGVSLKISSKIRLKVIMPVLAEIPAAIVGIGVLQFIMLYNAFIASGQGQGTLSHMYWAERLMELPLTLISVSFGTVMLPRLSALAMSNKTKEFSQIFEENIILAAFFVLPAAAGLYALAEPIVSLLFQRGNFNSWDLKQTSLLVRYGAGILVIQSLYRLVLSVFQVRKLNSIVLSAFLGTCIVHLLISKPAIEMWGIAGLMMATLFSLTLNALYLLAIYIYKSGWGAQEGGRAELLRIAASSIFMFIFLILLKERYFLVSNAWKIGSIFLGMAAYIFMLIWLRSRTLRLITSRVFR